MITANRISKSFSKNTILQDFSLTINQGEFLSLTGESGTGKTTLINLLSLLETPDNGDITFDGIKNPNLKQRMLLQRNQFGYLFQNFALVSNDTVESNIKLSLAYQKKGNKQEKIRDALDKVGLAGYERKKIYTLSGGQQQRVALARVIAKDPTYIFADEPTGNLDVKNRDLIFDLLLSLNKMGKTIVMVTHDLELAAKTSQSINL
ncbi:ABC transporter ATP-binding protein [Shouchella miscanthi]|uniref:ATP-binding cassette domain-containing protein n=1 Tax=Shouchella miscanthi TaxID=2598861 RepID=A0ABU6NLT7_9BACI|nr:ATP-binding cassette domain-containing protein [Shouchella miscanthi]MED4127727.1 ATP-binding cassette domain-containing protein [Shouchella miscanthi]